MKKESWGSLGSAKGDAQIEWGTVVPAVCWDVLPSACVVSKGSKKEKSSPVPVQPSELQIGAMPGSR